MQRAAGERLPGALVVPVGLAAALVVAQLVIWEPSLAPAVTPVVVAVAVVGLALDRPWRGLRARLDRAALIAAVAAFLVYGAPVLLSGQATYTGYIKLDDSATFFALADRAVEHGRDFGGLVPSTYQQTLAAYMGNGYPVGSLLPAAVVRPLVGQDLAWVYNPWMAFLAAMLALASYALARELLSPRRAALAAFGATASSLMFGYVMWGGVKEIAAAALVATTAALVPPLARGGRSVRALVPLAILVAAIVYTLSIGGAPWIAPLLLLAAALVLPRLTRRHVVLAGVVTVAVLVPALGTVRRFLETSDALTAQSELGNLAASLHASQVFGVWLGGDFRFDPQFPLLSALLVGLALAGAVGGLVIAVQRRAWGLLGYLGAIAVGGVALTVRGSPWVDGKTLAISSPAVLLLALVGLLAVPGTGPAARRALAGLAAVLVAGVLVGNALTYHQTFLAPRDRLAELERFGHRLDPAHRPTLLPLYDPVAARHLLREGDTDSASDLRAAQIFLNSGQTLPKGSFADTDAFRIGELYRFKSIIQPRSPVTSRPPATYELAAAGRWYDLWQRTEGRGGKLLVHVPLGSSDEAQGPASCRQVRGFAERARRTGAVLATVRRPRAMVLPVTAGSHPAAWAPFAGGLQTSTGGRAEVTAPVPHTGVYKIWLTGSLAGRATVTAGGRRVGTATGLANGGVPLPVGTVRLNAGRQKIRVDYARRALSPGTGVPLTHLDRVIVAPPIGRQPVEFVQPRDYRRLCGRVLDWIDIVRPAPRAGRR